MSKKVEILFFAANPGDTSQLMLAEEVRDIRNKLSATTHGSDYTLVPALAAQPDDFLQELNARTPSVLHFSGHGINKKGIVLQSTTGSAEVVSNEALVRLFDSIKHKIKIIVLNACYTKTQAEALCSIIDCVIGMNSSIGDEAARVFAASFYRALGFGNSVSHAFKQGVAALHLNNYPDVSIPELLVRKEVDPDDIYIFPLAEIDANELTGDYGDGLPGEPEKKQNSGVQCVVDYLRKVMGSGLTIDIHNLSLPCSLLQGRLGLDQVNH